MGDYNQHFLTSMSGAEGNSAANPDVLNPSAGLGVPLRAAAATGPHGNSRHPGSFHKPLIILRPSKGRKKLAAGSGAGADYVKHRRTRSGCFKCRSRRVKCDETHPICQRCRKGDRNCVYPDPPSRRGASNQSKSKDAAAPVQEPSPKSSNDHEEDGMELNRKSEAIPDEGEHEEQRHKGGCILQAPRTRSMAASSVPRLAGRHSSESLSLEDAMSSSYPSTSTTGSVSTNAAQPCDIALAPERRMAWSHLAPDFQHHLEYFVKNITNYHYSIANDGDEFFSTILPHMAVRHEPLLYAVVGFSSYHAMLQNPNGQLQDFLKYYNGGVTRLLDCLKRKETSNVQTLITILQLATIEEFLGDWANLMGHQRAAFEIMTQIFTPETAMQTAVGRMCLNWYSRYDNRVAIMGGFHTELPREWFNMMVEYNQTQTEANPRDLRWKIDDRSARLRVLLYDMSMLYARGGRGQISLEEFTREHSKVTQELLEWKKSWDPALVDPIYLVTDFSYREPVDPGDIVDPYKPRVLFKPPLFTTTLMSAEWHSIFILHLSQSARTPSMQLFAQLRRHAYAACQYFESVELWPLKPKGSMISLQSCISIAALFLPRDVQHQMWIRRKLALLDMLGFIHPTNRRVEMAQLFRDPSCAQWWLPNGEGLTPILQSICTFADERNAVAVGAQQENHRQVRHLFARAEVGDQEAEANGEKRDSSSLR